MADDDVFAAHGLEHIGGQLAGVGALLGKVHVLRAQLDVGALDGGNQDKIYNQRRRNFD